MKEKEQRRKNNENLQMKRYIAVSSIVILLPVLPGIYLWERLPERIATHFGAGNIPNGWSSREFVVFGLPIFLLAAHLICITVTRADPRRSCITAKMWKLLYFICPLVSLVCSFSTYAYALSWNINVDKIARIFLGLILIIAGNYLPKCRQNYTLGIKLPWTLDNEQNWNQTHRVAGWLWMPCGIILIFNALFNICGIWLEGTVMALIIIVPAVYSYTYYIRHRE